MLKFVILYSNFIEYRAITNYNLSTSWTPIKGLALHHSNMIETILKRADNQAPHFAGGASISLRC